MKYFLPRSLLLCLFLSPYFLTGQGLDWALTYRYNPGTIIGDIEPTANGPRQQSVYTLSTELELRGSAKFGWIIGFAGELIETGKSGDTTDDVLGGFNIIHPYTSQISTAYLRLGTQYNIRILEGDLSIGLFTGPGVGRYRRDWNVLNLLVADDAIISRDPGFTTLTDESTSTFRIMAAARLQYTYWFTPALAFSAGIEYSQSHYLGGGVETPRGVRYEIDEQGFIPGGSPGRRAPLIYDINYDRTTQMPDPSLVIRQFQLTLGITARI